MRVQVVIDTSAFQRAIERQAAPIIERMLSETKVEINEDSIAPKTGPEYRLRDGRRHRASGPGESPARRTGALLASISEPQVGKVGNALVGVLVIAAPYAGYLERGTPRIKPRPFARKSVEEVLRRLG